MLLLLMLVLILLSHEDINISSSLLINLKLSVTNGEVSDQCYVIQESMLGGSTAEICPKRIEIGVKLHTSKQKKERTFRSCNKRE